MSATHRDDRFALQRCGADTAAGRYLRRFWHPIALAESVRNSRTRVVRMLGEDVALYRGASGQMYAIDARCAHRCTSLAAGSVEGEYLRCRYHGWMYDGSGQCVEQPAEPEPFAAKIKLRRFPVEEYLGLIFCWFGTEPPSALPRYPQLEEAGLLRNSGYVRDCNYYQNIDNHCDPVHVNFAHRLSLYQDMTTAGASGDVPIVTAEETDYGMALHNTYPDGRRSTNHVIVPNAVQFALPPSVPGEEGWSDHLAWRVPIDDERHFSCRVELRRLTPEGKALFLADEARRKERQRTSPAAVREMLAQILSGDAALEDFVSELNADDLVNLEDTLSQEGQGALVDRSREHLGRTDAAIILYRKIHQREIRAMEGGQALKGWTVPKTVATTGV